MTTTETAPAPGVTDPAALLAELGAMTFTQIVTNMERVGVRTGPNDFCQSTRCVVARYLAHRTGIDYVSVGLTAASFGPEDDEDRLLLVLPDPLRRVVQAFDNGELCQFVEVPA